MPHDAAVRAKWAYGKHSGEPDQFVLGQGEFCLPQNESKRPIARSLWQPYNASMSTDTIVIIIVLVLLFGGGGFFFSRRR